jgi:acetyl esterase/lipase
MAIPLQTRLFWTALSRLRGPSIIQLPPAEIPAARDRRKRLVDLPGAAAVVGRPHPDVLIGMKKGRGADGADLLVRTYRPTGSVDERLPLIVNFHGGAFVSGDPKQSEWWCSSIAHDVHAVVVSVDYRLAPEHPYPTPPEDCYAATAWAVERAAALGADGSRLAIMGDSAGGNLAAAVAVMARDRGGPKIALQVLIYPAVDHVNSYPSEDENEFAPMLGKADLQAAPVYCPGNEHEPYASPLFADHTGLAPAHIQTAQHDPLRDQGTAYAAALRAAGVPVRLVNYVDGVHGYISIPGVQPCARQALADAAIALRTALQVPELGEQKAHE